MIYPIIRLNFLFISNISIYSIFGGHTVEKLQFFLHLSEQYLTYLGFCFSLHSAIPTENASHIFPCFAAPILHIIPNIFLSRTSDVVNSFMIVQDHLESISHLCYIIYEVLPVKTYTIIGGVNGVGKSSFTGVLKERTMDLGVIIDVDKITAELGSNTLAGGKAALTKIRDCIARNVSFTQETTLSGYKTEATAKQVKELGYYVRLFYMGLDTLDESLSRIENRGRVLPTSI